MISAGSKRAVLRMMIDGDLPVFHMRREQRAEATVVGHEFAGLDFHAACIAGSL